MNAYHSIEVTLAGMQMLVNSVQRANAVDAIEVTLPSSGMTLALQPTTNVLLSVLIMQFPLLWYTGFPSSTVKEVHSLNRPFAIEEIPRGITTSPSIVLGT